MTPDGECRIRNLEQEALEFADGYFEKGSVDRKSDGLQQAILLYKGSHLIHHFTRVSDLQADFVQLCRPSDRNDSFGESGSTQHQKSPGIDWSCCRFVGT